MNTIKNAGLAAKLASVGMVAALAIGASAGMAAATDPAPAVAPLATSVITPSAGQKTQQLVAIHVNVHATGASYVNPLTPHNKPLGFSGVSVTCVGNGGARVSKTGQLVFDHGDFDGKTLASELTFDRPIFFLGVNPQACFVRAAGRFGKQASDTGSKFVTIDGDTRLVADFELALS